VARIGITMEQLDHMFGTVHERIIDVLAHHEGMSDEH
jgi:hypothetical protein